mmetsp:Transcript_4274/g.16729  ORF Transcript_4274/g.16729 Transcript_4274/m.16729 type:complete len:309 (-) Transcript_4274:385-1311(-)
MRVTAFAFAAFVATARAELIRFFGEDINPAGLGNANAVTPLTEAPNSDAARDDFFEYLVDPVGATQDLDGLTAVSFPFPSGTPPPITLTYPDGDGGFFNATIRGAFILDEVRNGQYPISERNYLRAPNNTWTITFDCDIVGFGFYGVDIGDVDGQLNVTLEFSMADGDGMLTLQAEHTQDASGNVLYFGFLNEDNKIREITIKNVEDENDDFVFDNFTVAKPGNVARCVTGITNSEGTVCCCDEPSCTRCGGCDCADQPGGAMECCPGYIQENLMLCDSATDCGCVLVPEEAPFGPSFFDGGAGECTD